MITVTTAHRRDAGYAVVVAAAPTHVLADREVFLDHVSAADGRASARVAASSASGPPGRVNSRVVRTTAA